MPDSIPMLDSDPIASVIESRAQSPDLPKVADDAAFSQLKPGTKFLDPEGKQRQKPWSIGAGLTYEDIPEGETFVDPEGKQRQKPKYEGVDFTTQTLYDIALTPKEKRNVLARTYGADAVKESEGTGDLYVEQDGKRLKPGAGSLLKRGAAEAMAQGAPVLGSIGGEILGGAGGSAVPGPGTIAGAVAGGAGGAAVGQAFNDMILGLAGVYDRTPGQEVGNVALSAGAGGAGTIAGRAIAAVAPTVKGAVKSITTGLPALVAKYVGAGADPEAAATATKLAAQGVRVPPSAWMKEAPYLKKTVEEFDPVFRQQDVLGQSAQSHYEAKGGKILEDLGVPPESRPSLTEAVSPVSSREAGVAVLNRVKGDLAQEDAKFHQATVAANALTTARQAAGVEAEKSYAQAMSTLLESEATARKAAQSAIDEGFNSIRADVGEAAKAAQTNENPGDLMRAAAAKIKALNVAVKARASAMYDAADAAAGNARPNLGDLPRDAQAFADELPEQIKAKYPAIIKQIGELKNGETTFGQLRNLRSVIRQDIHPNDLTPSIKQGSLKYFAAKIDEVLHEGESSPNHYVSRDNLKTAVELLDRADAFYAKNMPRFRDEVVKGLTAALKAGMPADPKMVAGMIFREGQTERMREIRKIVGPQVWAAIQAADTQAIFDASKTLIPGEVNGQTFAKEVLARAQNGVLENGYSAELAAKLRTQALRVLAADGKVPLEQLPGDTVSAALRRADEYAAQAEALAKTDPLGTLQAETKKAGAQLKMQMAAMRQQRKQGALGFLSDAASQPEHTAYAIKSADRILASPDLILAAASRFGEQSPEFTMLRQVYAQRLLQRSLGKTPALAKDFAEKITPEVQAVMFPGVSLSDAQTLAKDMAFLAPSGSDTGGSIAAMERVMHPWGSIPHVLGTDIGGIVGAVPGSDALGRAILTKYYAFLSWGTTHPAFVQWVVKGLKSSDPAARAAVKASVQRAMQRGGAIGAGVGEEIEQQ